MPENSRSQLLLLRNTRWVVRFSVLEVFRDVYNAAVKAICQDIVYELSPRNSKLASKATLSSVCVFHLPSSYGRTISIVSRYMLEACATLVVPRMCSFLILYLRVTPYIQSTIAPSSRFLDPFFLSLNCSTWFWPVDEGFFFFSSFLNVICIPYRCVHIMYSTSRQYASSRSANAVKLLVVA